MFIPYALNCSLRTFSINSYSANNFLTIGSALFEKSRRMTAIGNFYFQHQLKASLRLPPSFFKLVCRPTYYSTFFLKGLSSPPFKNLGTVYHKKYQCFGKMFDGLSRDTFCRNFFLFSWIICTVSIICHHHLDMLREDQWDRRRHLVDATQDRRHVLVEFQVVVAVGWSVCWWMPV